MKALQTALCIAIVSVPSVTRAQPAPAEMAEWKMPWGKEVPGVMSVADLIPRPAGKSGPVVARDGHFYEGSQRLRFFGASIAFGGAFPTHEQADRVAERLARFGINCVRFHHIDMQPFPTGIFADDAGEKFSPEAQDRLDYFIAALKANGVYSDLNLHVSRTWSKIHHWPNADQLPDFDKMVDIFNPELIAANKQYARDLLTHVNPYTKTRLADEPAVGFIEINNEDTLFLWGGEPKLAELPEPYVSQLQSLWNKWLVKKYGTREGLKTAWAAGEEAVGENVLAEPWTGQKWLPEMQGGAKMELQVDGAPDAPVQALVVNKVSGTDWHLQFFEPNLTLTKGKHYTLSFTANALNGVEIGVGVAEAHEPWHSLGLGERCVLTKEPHAFRFSFVALADDNNARVSFSVGHAIDTVFLKSVELCEGGIRGLTTSEDPAASNVANGGPQKGTTPARARDWYDFLQQTDEAYFTDMRRFLREDLGVKCPITGTIGLGPLGTRSQASMDFVDAHAYWEHPRFPHRQWDSRDWEIDNHPMVDNPAGATLWGLAATRVAGKPFTVTEYNHSAPNEWQAEGIPLIAAYAALQDWDGIFLFAYSHNNDYEKTHTLSFFDVEGNPLKMDLIPVASRLFVGGALPPLANYLLVMPQREQMLDTGSQYFFQQWPYVRDTQGVTWQQALQNRLAISFDKKASTLTTNPKEEQRVKWTSNGPGTYTGRFIVGDPHAAIFVGFSTGAMPIDLGSVSIEKLQSPFVSIVLTPANVGETLESAHRLLLTVAARQSNTGMQWNASRTSVGDQWGTAPPLVETVSGTISLRSARPITAFALTPDGQRGAKIPTRFENGRAMIELGSEKTIWYELERE